MSSILTAARAGVVAVIVVGVLGVVEVGFGAEPARAAFGAVTQESDRAPGEPCLPGASLPTPGQPPNGPAPVGRCEPSTRRRAVDTAIWIGLVVVMAAAVVAGLVVARRDRRDDGSTERR